MARSNKLAAEVSEQDAAPKAAPAEAPVSTDGADPKVGQAVEIVAPAPQPEDKPKEKKGVRVLKDGTVLTDNTFAEGALNPNQSPNVFFVQQPPKRRVDLAGGTVREDY